MSPAEVSWVVWLVAGLTCFALGAMCGIRSERNAWVSRAMPKNQTPHHCDGEFYYVVPESVFCREYMPRPYPERD